MPDLILTAEEADSGQFAHTSLPFRKAHLTFSTLSLSLQTGYLQSGPSVLP